MLALIYTNSKDRKTLADRLVAYSDLSRQEAENLASEAGPGPHRPPPLLDAAAILAALPEEKQRTFRFRSLLLERSLNHAYPLAIDEETSEDGHLMTCLSEAWLEYPNGTIAFRRKTNLGEIVFLNQEFTFDLENKEIIDNRPDYSPEALARTEPEEVAFWATLALDIAKSLLGALAGKIGSAIFAKLFPPSVPAYFEQVYQQFRVIVRQELEENTIRLLTGKVAAVLDHMRNYATHMRGGNSVAAELEISAAWNSSVEVTNQLLQFPVAGLGTFVTAGGLHLAILQERALRDQLVEDPNLSTFAELYRDKAKQFALYAGQQPDKIVSDRGRVISEVRFERRTGHIPGGGPIDNSYWWWTDPLSGGERRYPVRTGCCASNPEGKARSDRAAHYNNMINPLTNNLKPVKDIAREWDRAWQQPLPQFGIPGDPEG